MSSANGDPELESTEDPRPAAGPVQTRGLDTLELEGAIAMLPCIVGACHRNLGSPLGTDELQDVIQQVGLTVMNKQGTFERRSKVETWLYGIARFVIFTEVRRKREEGRRRLDAAPEDLSACGVGTPSVKMGGSSLWTHLELALDGAGTTAAKIMRLHLVEGLSLCETGDRMQLPYNTAKSRYRRYLPKLQEALGRLRPELIRGRTRDTSTRGR